MENTIKLRIKFKKFGAVRYIGHLDVMRFFQKAIRRAEIDIAYTSGYSPHQIMTFAAPLGVGLESNGEYMDIEVISQVSCEDTMKRLNAVSVHGIEVISVVVLPKEAGNAMASVAAASYTVRFRDGREPHVKIEDILPAFLKLEKIIYTKETKKGTREINLRPGIFDLTWDGAAFHMLVDASSSGNIKPIQIIQSLLHINDEELKENALFVVREEIYTNTGTIDNPTFTPLYAIGSNEISD